MTAPPGSPAPARRLDASMTLLREAMDRPLDPGYAAAAADPRPRTRQGMVVTAVLAVLAGYLFSVAVVYIRAPQPEATKALERLREEINRRTGQIEAREQANAKLRDEITRAQRTALQGSGGADLPDRVERLGLVVGELPVSGPGLRFSIDDAPGTDTGVGGVDPRDQNDVSGGTVLDSDLQVVVNGLWDAGAEAVAINGERMTSLSAIRSAGQAILVDFRPLAPPYVVDAIGDPATLQASFAAGDAGPYLQSMQDNSGIRVSITPEEDLTLPGAGHLVLRAARAAAGPAASSTSQSSNESSSTGEGSP